MTTEERNKLIDDYAWRVVDDMDDQRPSAALWQIWSSETLNNNKR